MITNEPQQHQVWTPPVSMEEAQERYNNLLAAKQDIEAQLGNDLPRRKYDGTYFTAQEQDAWRASAKSAKAHIEDDYRRTKQWIQTQRDGQPGASGERLRKLRWLAHNVIEAWDKVSPNPPHPDYRLVAQCIEALREELAKAA